MASDRLFTPALLEQLSVGDFVRLCNSNTSTRQRCQRDEIIQNLFLKKLGENLVYIVNTFNHSKIEVNLNKVNPYSLNKSSFNIVLSFDNIRQLRTQLNKLIELSTETDVSTKYINLGHWKYMKNEDNFYFISSGTDRYAKMSVSVFPELLIEILTLLGEEPDENHQMFVYNDNTIFLTNPGEMFDTFGEDFVEDIYDPFLSNYMM